ncbi:glutathione gamma-glutamylcysteinyltransferase 1 [Elysia marginata]|uniref:glutathione gamma-glutamylcysteinyltransferase n=1 Tax=Elysia marginata TaxID=1093978 RepID=A0AAV4H069_9GAST|nr:glutathione gamma-glutamylcysteinyltransferase 1 [Elysia marginata]
MEKGTMHETGTSAITKQSIFKKSLPHSCIDFSSPEGKKVFSEALASGYMECFFKLSSQLRTQEDVAYSGLSTLVMILNAFRLDPGKVWKGPWRWYHESMLGCCTLSEVFQEKGIDMVQFVCLAKYHGLHPKAVYNSEINSLDMLRKEVMQATRSEDVVLVANYSRQKLDQIGEGHFAPIGGYHASRDLVLILDTARFIYPPHWVQLGALYKAMKTIDIESGTPRGFVLVTVAKQQPTPLISTWMNGCQCFHHRPP